jgi:hypothetical protein
MTAAAFCSVTVDSFAITMRDFARPSSTSVISCPLELQIRKIEHTSKTLRFLIIIYLILPHHHYQQDQ